MRIILRFGGFCQEIKIPDSKAFQPLVIPHPPERITLTKEGAIAQDNPILFKGHAFEYARQLEHDLLEYKFVREE